MRERPCVPVLPDRGLRGCKALVTLLRCTILVKLKKDFLFRNFHIDTRRVKCCRARVTLPLPGNTRDPGMTGCRLILHRANARIYPCFRFSTALISSKFRKEKVRDAMNLCDAHCADRSFAGDLSCVPPQSESSRSAARLSCQHYSFLCEAKDDRSIASLERSHNQ